MRLTISCCVLFMAACSSPSDPPKPALTYPATTMGTVAEDYHGTKVPDPYRWMENLDSPDVAAWVKAQNAVTDPYLAALPRRKALNERLTALWDYPRVGLPSLEGGQMFYAKNSGLQRQAPIFRRDGIDKPPTLVIDPNVISEEGTVSFAEYKVSPDAKLMAYGLSEGGADWETIHVRDLATGKDLADEVRWMRFSGISWTKDAKGFYYSRYPEPPKGKVLEAALSGHTLYYHRVGTPQSEDLLVYERKDLPGWIINGGVTEDGRYLLILMFEGSGNKNRLYAADLGNAKTPNLKAPVKPVIEADDAEFLPIGNQGSVVFLRSDKDAPNRKVIAIDLQNPAPAAWKTIVPEQPQALETVAVIGGLVVAQYLVDVQSRLRLFGLDGSEQGDIALPGIGTVGALSGREDTPGVWYTFTSPLAPSTVYRYDPATKKSTPFEPPPLPIDLKRLRDQGDVRHVEGRHQGPLLPDREEGTRARRQQPDDDLRLRRVLDQHAACVSAGRAGLARDGRRVGDGQHARRRGVRREVARGRDAGPQAERLRRLHCRRRASGEREVHVAGKARRDGRLERRHARRRRDQPAPGSLRGGAARSGRDGHAALRPLHRRPAVGAGVRLGAERRAVPVSDQVLTGAEREEGRLLSGDARDHRRSRRPRRAEPLVQVRGRDCRPRRAAPTRY